MNIYGEGNLQKHAIGLLTYDDDLILMTELQNELKSLFS